MPVYEYEAKLITGEIKSGKMEAIDEGSVRSSLRAMNYYPVVIKEQGKNTIDLSKLRKVAIKDIAIFCRQFSYILISGMGILKALEILSAQTENKKLKKAIMMVYDDVQKGKELSGSMKKQEVFPEMLINMVAVGESGGNLDEIMKKLSEYYDKEYILKQKIKQALTYPIIVLVFALIIVNVLVIKVLPMLLGGMMNDQGSLPVTTQILLKISSFLQNNIILIVLGVLILIVLFNIYGKSKKSVSVDKFKLRIPVFGKINLKIVTSNFARTFGMLLGSGLPIIMSIEIASKVVGNTFVEGVLKESTEDIKKGLSLGDSLESKNVFPPMLTQMIKVGEESGTLDSTLGKTAEFFEMEAQTATTQLTTMIEPLIIILLAVVVGFIIVSIILPIFQMYDSVGS